MVGIECSLSYFKRFYLSEAFVCEEASEASELMQELRKHFKKVSVIHGDLSKLRQFEEGGTRYRERHTAGELDRFKFVSYVADMFTGQYSTVQYSTVQYSTVQYIIVQ